MIEGRPIDREVIHENFHNFFNHVRENGHHAPLERRGCVTLPKQHSSVGICSIGAYECGLALIYGTDGYLMITRITIKETEVGVLRQPL